MEIVWGVLKESWHIWMEASVYLLFGFFVAGIIHVFFTPEKIVKYLAGSKIRSVLYAALFGVPLPLCSCGVVPAALSLKKNGANNGAVLSFLISTPVSGVDSIALTYTLLDPIMTVARPLSGFLAGSIAGILENFFGSSISVFSPSSSDSCCASGVKSSLRKRMAEGFRYAFIDLTTDIARWFLVGMLLAGVISYLIPHHWVEHYLGGGFSSMFIMLVVGIPLYICASASTPIAAALILKGMSPGTALVFLLAGSATNIASLVVLAKFLGKWAITVYLGSIAVCSIVFGLLLDAIYTMLNIQPHALSGTATSIFPPAVVWSASFILAFLMLLGLVRRRRNLK